MHKEEDDNSVVGAGALYKELWMVLENVANLRVLSELRFVDDAFDWDKNVRFTESDITNRWYSNKFAFLTESDGKPAGWSNNSFVFTPLIELDKLLFLFDFARFLPIDLEFLAIAELRLSL